MKLYLLECWTHAMYPGPDGMCHDTYNVGIFSSKERAIKYAKSKPNYAGKEDNWDWVITRFYLDEDNESAEMPVHYSRHGILLPDPASYTPDLTPEQSVKLHKNLNKYLKDIGEYVPVRKNEWDQEHEHDAQYQLDDDDEEEADTGCNPFIDEEDAYDKAMDREEDIDEEDEEKDTDDLFVKNGTVIATQPIHTQEDVDEYMIQLQNLKHHLPHREKKTVTQRVVELQKEILKILEEE